MMFCSFPKTGKLTPYMVLVWFVCAFGTANWRDGLFSEIGVLLTFIVQAAANGELGVVSTHEPFVGKEKKSFFFVSFFCWAVMH